MNNFIKKIVNFFQIRKYFKSNKNNDLKIHTLLRSSRITIKGLKNRLSIENSNIKRLKIGISGNNNIVTIHKNCMIRDLNIIMEGNNLEILIKENCEIGGATIVCCGENSSIYLDENCLLASNIEIRNNDGHIIYENEVIINPSKNIHISNNVWICQNVKILKGTYIGSNSVIALNSLVTKGIYDNNVILAGSPAKIIKRNITWNKNRPN